MQILAFRAKRGKIRACSFWFCHCFSWENLSQKVSETALTSYFPVIPYGNPCQGHIVNHQIKTKEAQGWACGQFLNFTLGTNLRFTFVSPQIPWSTLPTKLTYLCMDWHTSFRGSVNLSIARDEEEQFLHKMHSLLTAGPGWTEIS